MGFKVRGSGALALRASRADPGERRRLEGRDLQQRPPLAQPARELERCAPLPRSCNAENQRAFVQQRGCSSLEWPLTRCIQARNRVWRRATPGARRTPRRRIRDIATTYLL